MNVEALFNLHEVRQIDKWKHYFPLYEQHLAPYRNFAKRILEIGVDHGGSLQLWKQYFPHAEIVGVDIEPRCKDYTEDRITVRIGSQTDVAFLESLGEFDIVIDDGSHNTNDQEISYKTLWPKTKSVYIIEDCHGAYPALNFPPVFYRYPWMIVVERPTRIIRGTPSRELRPDEADAVALFGVKNV